MLQTDRGILRYRAAFMLRHVLQIQNIIKFAELRNAEVDAEAVADHLTEVVDHAEKIVEILTRNEFERGKFETVRH